MQSPGSGNPMSAAQIARLQQQLAQQYGRGQVGGGQTMMNNAMGGGNAQQQQLQFMQQGLQQQSSQQNLLSQNSNQSQNQQQNQNHHQQQQQAPQQNQQQPGMQVRRNSSLAGMSNTAALAMMQQQQQQQQAVAGNSQMANANMSSYWNALQNQNTGGGAMDASSASSAQLAALAGMGMSSGAQGNSNANMQALLGRQGGSQQQPQQQSLAQAMPNQQMQGMVGTQGSDGGQNSLLLQQQIAQLQRQLQQQQQQQQQQQNLGQAPQHTSGMADRRASGGAGNFPLQHQQQLFQQIQQQNQRGGSASSNMLQQVAGGMIGQDAQQAMGMVAAAAQQNKIGNDQFSSMAAMMQGQNVSAAQMHSVQQNLRNSMTAQNTQGIMGQGGGGRGTLNEQELLLQQQQLLRSSGLSQGMGNDAQFATNQAQLGGGGTLDPMSGRGSSHMDAMAGNMNSTSPQGLPNSQGMMGQNAGFGNMNPFDMDNSMSSSQRSVARRKMTDDKGTPLDVTSNQQAGGKPDEPSSSQKSFLDGSFAGGWQSNADLPDRRRIIFSILEVIRQMRPDTNKISQKLPHMAKSLEEHLYRSAQTKEEYLDPSTLKKRLQLIAHGLELHRSTSSGSIHSATDQPMNQNTGSGVQNESQQLQQLLQMQGGMGRGNQSLDGSMSGTSIPAMVGGNNGMQPDLLAGLGDSMSGTMNQIGNPDAAGNLKTDTAKYQDPIATQKKKVIRQQQQRLLLLRHASKCKEGPNCKTKFCGQMMTLWKHMKKCRDKNCKTSHCLSSRCVLNHYRICKSQGRTSTCEVCGPVMEQIKRQDQGDGIDGSDPLAAKPDPDLPNQVIPNLQRQTSGFGGDNSQNSIQAMQQQAMQQLYQQQQQAVVQQQQQQGAMGQNNNNPNTLQAMGGGGGPSLAAQIDDSQNPSGNGQADPQQLQQLQQAQQKLYQQQQVLKQLQKQQAQLLDQQKQLQEQQQHLKDPQTQQGQQLQQQHALLQQLQRRCQQQQALIQQELVMQMKALQQGGQPMSNNSQSSQHSQHSQHSRSASIGSQNQAQQNQTQTMNQGMNQNMGMDNQNMNQAVGMNQSMNRNQNQNQNNMQGDQLQAQMQALSQSHLQALNSNSNSNNSANGNQMQGQQGNQQQQLQQALQNQNFTQMQQALQQQQQNQQQAGGMQANQQQPQQNQQGNNNQPSSGASSPGANSSLKGMQQLGKNDNAANANTKRRAPTNKNRALPSGGRGKGARGRGGKGKRLREIADDLIPSSQASTARIPGASINKSSAEAAAMSVLSKKRTADEIEGGDNNDESNKSAKTDGKDGDNENKDSGVDDKKSDEKKDDKGASLASSMAKGDVEQHLESLHKGLHLTSRTITHKCLPIVQQLIDDPFGWVFRDAVDPVVFGLPDYFEVVKNPMHLLLVKKKLENAVYTDMASFERDVKLVFENSILYNGEDSEVGQLANSMMSVFEKEYRKVCEGIKINNQTIDRDQHACALCGEQRRLFEPTALYCSGKCMQKIRRNSIYHTDRIKQNFWCQPCFSGLRENQKIVLDDGSEIKKAQLQSCKNDAVPEETWVQCDDCNQWCHQICALFNGRKNKTKAPFSCPKCILKQRSGKENVSLEPAKGAKELATCKMSDAIEKGMLKTLSNAYEAKAQELGVGIDQIEKAEGLTIRVMSHIEKTHAIRDEMYQKYSKTGCATEFPVRTKCIGLFQSVHGVDILLFAMFVYEYDDKCPSPNRRRVYISYLDSVQYFHPSPYRTVAFQSVLVEYLRFVKERGFHTAHIWSCPPTPGDDYIFYIHPSSQKIPKEEMLRNWYHQVLEKAKTEGIVMETSNIHDEYFKNGGISSPSGSAVDPTSLPYFEGDYIPGEIENILVQLKEEARREGTKWDSGDGFIRPRPTGAKIGTRSNPGQLVNQYQDKVMLRLGQCINKMKDNFMVVRLRSKRFVAAVERGDDVSGWPDESDEDNIPKINGKDSSILKQGDEEEPSKDYDLNQQKALDAIEPTIAKHIADLKRNATKVGCTIDEDEPFESELIENRQLFLNYCQNNHCQFDELRRAKHATMMVLFQLHNPMAPKFLQQCGACYREIAHGFRYHCSDCANFDLCEECYQPVVSGSWKQRGSRYTHDKSHTFSRISMEISEDAKKTQEERARSLKTHLELLAHCAKCEGAPACKLKNCDKMKKLFIHVESCDITFRRGCKVCTRLLSLLTVHARSCTVRGTCPLPFCDRIRERNERLRRQQQLMDDRRRQAQNELYRAGD